MSSVKGFTGAIGCLVRVDGDPRLMAKLVAQGEDCGAEVEWFSGVAWRRREHIPAAFLRRECLPAQTRCYVADEFGETWRMGRVLQSSVSLDRRWYEYDIAFPNQQVATVREDRVYVRCLGGGAGPLDTLAYEAQETPFLYERRSLVLRCLTEQRAVSQGMTALMSAPVLLLPHQVAAVRKVLEDPVQRYLLADEVGLGKTIEAGIIIRQVLLDDVEARALVVVPPFLLAQWKRELQERLRLEVEDRITLVDTDNVLDLDVEGFEIVVIDEAHHVAHARGTRREALWEACRQIALTTPRLLLLSATPALHHEQDFLAMLHLLDPAAYSLEDLELLRQRIAARQPVGSFLLGFREGMATPPLRRALVRLRTLFPDDVWIQERAEALAAALSPAEGQDVEPGQVRRIVREIRVGICETHRLYRRMIRTPRTALPPTTLLPRAARADQPLLLVDPGSDDRAERIEELLEEWRFGAQAVSEEADRAALVDVYLALGECAGAWLGLLAAAARVRLALLGRGATGAPARLLGRTLAAPLESPITFPGEAPLLRALEAAASAKPEGPDELDVLTQAVRLSLAAGDRRCVVFVSHPASGKAIVERLKAALSDCPVLTHLTHDSAELAEASLKQFRSGRQAAVLVTDRSGEEGLNLQCADRLIHFDLPWDPSRIEQRIGRLDRVGRSGEVRSRVVLPRESSASLQQAWLEVLRDGFGVFSNSISDLQFLIDRRMPGLHLAALEGGAEALRAQVEVLRAEIEQERLLLREQAELDEIEAFERDGDGRFAALQELDGQSEALQAATEGWVLECLRLKAELPRKLYDAHGFESPERSGQPIVRYEVGSRSLVPPGLWPGLAIPEGEWATYRRDLAVRSGGMDLLRIGHPFIEALQQLLDWDDRGQAFALWRVVKGIPEDAPRLFFRLDYLVEADLQAAEEALRQDGWDASARRALARRADAWLPPVHQTLFLNGSLKVETRPQFRKVLELPYEPADRGGRDFNLGGERPIPLDQLGLGGVWVKLCRKVRRVSESGMRADETLRQHCDTAARAAEEDLECRIEQLRQGLIWGRGGRWNGEGDSALAREQALYTALIHGIRQPRIRLDAAGLIVLASTRPVAGKSR